MLSKRAIRGAISHSAHGHPLGEKRLHDRILGTFAHLSLEDTSARLEECSHTPRLDAAADTDVIEGYDRTIRILELHQVVRVIQRQLAHTYHMEGANRACVQLIFKLRLTTA